MYHIYHIPGKKIGVTRNLEYKVDRQLYKDLINKKSNQMKINVTEQTTTFPVQKDKLKGHLMETIGMKWETLLGEFELTLESIRWIEQNAVVSMYDTQRSFIYNKAFHEAFTENFEEYKPTVYDDIRLWAAAKGIYTKGDSKTQYIKLLEEVGELQSAYNVIQNRKGKMINGTFVKES